MFVRVTFSSVDPRYLKNSLFYKKKKKKKFLLLFYLVVRRCNFVKKKKKREKRIKIRNNFFRCPDIYIYIRIVILPSYIYAIVARMHFLFSSLDVKAIFNIVIIAARQIHYIVEKCNPNTK